MKRRFRIPVQISHGNAQNPEIITQLHSAKFQAVCSHMVWFRVSVRNIRRFWDNLPCTSSTIQQRKHEGRSRTNPQRAQKWQWLILDYHRTINHQNGEWSFMKNGGYGSCRNQDEWKGVNQAIGSLRPLILGVSGVLDCYPLRTHQKQNRRLTTLTKQTLKRNLPTTKQKIAIATSG